MRSALCINLEEQKEMFARMGAEGACLHKNFQDSQMWPYIILGVADSTVSLLVDYYGKAMVEVDQSTNLVKVTDEVIARMAAEYLQVRQVEGVLLLECGELVAFLGTEVMETKEVTIYGGYVRNLATNKYDCLFSTELSALLACTRAREAAAYQNGTINQVKSEYEKKGGGELWLQFLDEQERNGNPNVAFYRLGKKYDISDIVVQSRRNIVTTVTGEWGRPAERDIDATQKAVSISKKNGDMPKFSFESSEGG